MADELKSETIVEHLSELRRRLIYVALVFTFVLVAAFFVVHPIYQYLTINSITGVEIKLNAFSFWDGVGVYMKIAMVVALGITLPFTLYQIWAFVSPGLRPRERKATLRYIPYVFLCFLIGIAFGYFVVFPLAMKFTAGLNKELGLIETYGMADYFKFLMNIVFPISLLFELPIVILFLTQLRLLTPTLLRKMRRVAYFILVVISVMITPADLFSAFLVLIPLIILYEISVLLSSRVHKKQLAADAKRAEEYS
ncbi:twin-arginine translocase subunit TatC [Paenibacillus lutimineralis]|uniref:Sec-independent protein translocase protein TatC n=1 Tax=Paenibacillus lutimineralis TaxID=2707005 RepID=A0A3S9UUY1_9BACL|nr:twin-arginine translocase subunit TatC [Paenibacillus lutimineralis]AZS14100.1 twin-arginine translocase subunit TatC [Paenibacillus lutimineralis]